MRYFVFGDIHGHADELCELLDFVGFRKDTVNGSVVWAHQDGTSKAVFVGDYIDRGPKIAEVVRIVRTMVEHATAFAVLGNHEYNAICFASKTKEVCQTSGPASYWLRNRTDKNLRQHLETLYQFRHKPDELQDMIRWFRSLPLELEFAGFRVAHAAWIAIDEAERLIPGLTLQDDAVLCGSATRGSPTFELVETVLKGFEVDLPQGVSFCDKDGHRRTRSRTAWWVDPHGKTYREIVYPPAMSTLEGLDLRVPESEALQFLHYDDQKPIFLGHYWLDGHPAVISNRVAILDYSVARFGRLVAYEWSGEATLDSRKLRWV